MSWIEGRYCSGISCDKPKCDRTIDGPELSYFFGRDHYQRLGAENGWTYWAGRRSWRSYCPDHGPSNPASMRRLDVR